MIISYLTSFILFNFVYNKFKFSNNIFIRFIQKFVIYNLCFILAIYTATYFNVFTTVYCDSDDEDNNDNIQNNNNIKDNNKNIKNNNNDNGNYTFEAKISAPKQIVDTLVNGVSVAIQNMGGNLGAAAAGGTAASAVIKHTTGLPPLTRVAMASTTALAVSGGVSIGQQLGKSVTKNESILEAIKKHNYADPDIERIPSPDNSFINSVLEDENIGIPLVDLLLNLISINLLEIILILLILLIYFNKNINNLNIKLFSNFTHKYIPKKYHNWINFLQGTNEYNHKFMNILLFINIVLLLLLIIGNLYISSELYLNIDNYVLVYNTLKKIIK
uniref:LAGLIDADG endonuclease n=1 Tax=Poriella subacida TaxID=2872513 RepID=UPI00300256D0|nr:LAGLIDADG endonuclease [Poriella subacida]